MSHRQTAPHCKTLCRAFVVLVGTFFLTGVDQRSASCQEVSFDTFSPRWDHLFPDEARLWRERDQPIREGLIEAGKLRQKLLSSDRRGKLLADRVCDEFNTFQIAAARHLQRAKPIDRFDMTSERLRAQLNGREKIDAQAFAAFDGRWFGRWADLEVNHDWQPTQMFPSPKSYAGTNLMLHGLQYAWISNGFGWNYLVTQLPSPVSSQIRFSQTADSAEQSPFILGMVYYFEGEDFSTIRGQKAHVGFADSSTRLVWITEKEIFLEEVFPTFDPAQTVYAITAMRHDLLADHPTVSSRGTQAIYTRDPSKRPEFLEFIWK